MDNEDLIRVQMEATRNAMTEKLMTLEEKVTTSVQEATSNVTATVEAVTDSVKETVDAVKGTVEETVTAAKETVQEGVVAVKDFFDVSGQVERHPWPMVGGAAALGFCLARLLTVRTGGYAAPVATAYATQAVPEPVRQTAHFGNGRHTNGRSQPSKPKSSFFDMFAPELAKLKSVAIGQLMSMARDAVHDAAPPNLRESLVELVDSATEKLGGQVTQRSQEEHESTVGGMPGRERAAGF